MRARRDACSIMWTVKCGEVLSLCVLRDLGDGDKSMLTDDMCDKKYLYIIDSVDFVPSLVSFFRYLHVNGLPLLRMGVLHPL